MNTPAIPRRALGLDALRGAAIITMVLSGRIPSTLPAWMFHAQVPPPDHIFNPNLPGLTWVDLVFPYFLFALGAAIPLALARRMAKGGSMGKVLLSILERGFLLSFFALFIAHIRPWAMPEGKTRYIVALLGFVLMFLVYTRFSESWPGTLRAMLKIAGWAGAFIFLWRIRYADGSGFSLGRNDIIIILLTTSAVFGSLAWLFTRENILMRLGLLGFLMALRLAAGSEGWIKFAAEKCGAVPWTSWVFQLGFLQYLFIVIPGTIAGDMLVRWMKQGDKPDADQTPAWSRTTLITLVWLVLAAHVVLLTGLFQRWGFGNVLVAAILLLIMAKVMKNPGNDMERLLRGFLGWAAYWLLLGLFFEPYEGGIKKDWATMSYYFVTSGMAIILMIGFMILIDILKVKSLLLRLTISNGQNPMIAYVALSNFISPVLILTGLIKVVDYVFEPSFLEKSALFPWIGFLKGCFLTFLLMCVVHFFTKRKIFWRT